MKARLYDADGKLVGMNDDRENDWNFLIPTRLPPGHYELQVLSFDHLRSSLRAFQGARPTMRPPNDVRRDT